jgi:hypothetical protein
MARPEVEDPNKSVSLELAVEGPVFTPGLPIPLTVRTLDNVQALLDRSYLVLAHKQRMSSRDRSLFFLRSQDIKHGSLLTTLGMVFAAAQPVLPVVSDLGPSGVWQYAKEAFAFLKLVFDAKKSGAPISISHSGDGSLTNVNTGSQTFTFNAPVYYIALGSLPQYEWIAHQLAPNRITDFRLGEGRRRDIALNVHERDLFDLPVKVEEASKTIRCEIFEFDKYEGAGELKVGDGQSIPAGEYKFHVVGNQNLAEYIEAMLHEQVTVTCLEETVDHPILGRKVASLHVLNVKKT